MVNTHFTYRWLAPHVVRAARRNCFKCYTCSKWPVSIHICMWWFLLHPNTDLVRMSQYSVLPWTHQFALLLPENVWGKQTMNPGLVLCSDWESWFVACQTVQLEYKLATSFLFCWKRAAGLKLLKLRANEHVNVSYISVLLSIGYPPPHTHTVWGPWSRSAP